MMYSNLRVHCCHCQRARARGAGVFLDRPTSGAFCAARLNL